MAEELPQTLAGAFARLRAALDELDAGKVDPKDRLVKVESALRVADLCERFFRADYVFSSNEVADDVNTHDLRYALLPFVVAELHQHWPPDGARLEHLVAALEYTKQFLALCRRLELIGDDLVSSEPVPSLQRRSLKVARFKQEKDLREKLKRVSEGLQRLAQRRGEDALECAEDSDELTRSETLLLLRLSALRAANSTDVLHEEIELLQQVSLLTKDEKDRIAAERQRFERQVHQLVQQVLPQARSRQEIARGVFRPSWQLPKYTIEQAGEIELELHDRILAQQRERQLARQAAAPAPESEQAQDAAERKAREWDDWKDDNPRGAGNRMARRG